MSPTAALASAEAMRQAAEGRNDDAGVPPAWAHAMKFHAPPAYEKPFDAVVVNGEVVIMGNRTSEALTPEAALESADRIRKAAEEALQRRVSGDADDEPW